MSCNFDNVTKAVLFVPGTTGACVGSTFGLTVNAHCSSSMGTGCSNLMFRYVIDQYTSLSPCTIKNNVSSGSCTNTGASAVCGSDSGDTNVCFSPNAPAGGWALGDYRITIDIYDTACNGTGTLLKEVVRYLNYNAIGAVWTILGGAPC